VTTATKNRIDGHASTSAPTLPPQNLPAELSLIGAALLGGVPIVDAVTGIIGPEDFYMPAHRVVWQAILKLRDTTEPIDAVTVFGALQKMPEAHSVGDIEVLLNDAMERVPYAHENHAKKHAEDIADPARRRQAIYAGSDLAVTARNEVLDLDEAVAEAETRLQAIIERKVTGQAVPMADVALETLARLGSPAKAGLPTGFRELDELIGGLKPGQLLIVAARPGVGKTAFAGNVSLQAVKAGTSVLFSSLEQSRGELFERFLCGETGFSTEYLRSEKMRGQDRVAVEFAANNLAILPLLIDDGTPRTVAQIAAQARLHRRRKNLGLVVVDYLQLISSDDKRQNRETQVAEISRSLKLLARGLEIPVMALAQLNRAVEARDNKRPRLSDLRESGAIEQDADVVIFLDRASTYDAKADPNDARLIVAKHRNGRTGDVKLEWNAETMRFSNLGPW
jgi:replicative DNA helicase